MTFTPKPLTVSLLRLLRSAPCQSQYNNIPSVLRASQAVEEERAPHYDPKHFYPMKIPTILADRKMALASPTLCGDKGQCKQAFLSKVRREELRITERITQAHTHEGRYFVRTLLDSFDLPGPHGKHVCMVFDPLFASTKRIDDWSFQSMADLKSDNILMALRDHSMLGKVIQDEIEDPLPQRILKDRTIHLSRNNFGFQARNLGRPVITDFGLSVSGDEGPHRHSIQPNEFRAPEVIIGASWSYSAVMVCYDHHIWELLCGAGPFDYSTSPDASYSEEKHLASMISLIGPPSDDMIMRGSKGRRCFNDHGHFKYPDLIQT
ncbi:unnamed protein product [Penicillium salamii]|uniref:non-specific serine/threonine protein kinase n=1 Tax=Penicillium salamii TaxID=1612424 RepID=A0A9W4JPL6_9EURO|nr:unnamed protein product [Penicillium salamii]